MLFGGRNLREELSNKWGLANFGASSVSWLTVQKEADQLPLLPRDQGPLHRGLSPQFDKRRFRDYDIFIVEPLLQRGHSSRLPVS
jgi:hypothetical protein